MVLLVDNVVGSLNPGFFPALILEVSKLVAGMKNVEERYESVSESAQIRIIHTHCDVISF
jgi:hypothetical protein